MAQGYKYTNLKTNAAATTLKSGAGVLHSITINTLGSADTVTVFDNTTNSSPTIGAINGAGIQTTLLYDIEFNTGLTVGIVGTTAPDITVCWI